MEEFVSKVAFYGVLLDIGVSESFLAIKTLNTNELYGYKCFEDPVSEF